MKKGLILCIVFHLLIAGKLFCQKKITDWQQSWLGYFNQTRFSNKWGLWTDIQLRTREQFVKDISSSFVRLGLTYYQNTDTKFTIGYAYLQHFPGKDQDRLLQEEHRIWQQVQWHSSFKKARMAQWLRLEERFKQKMADSSLPNKLFQYSSRLRYNIWYEYPITKNGIQPGAVSFIVNDELFINLGKSVVYNYFDQNRFFTGLKYNLGIRTNIQFGYLNVFQQLPLGDQFNNTHAARLVLVQNLDLRNKN